MVGVLSNLRNFSNDVSRQPVEKFQAINDGTITFVSFAPLIKDCNVYGKSVDSELNGAVIIVGDSLGKLSIFENRSGTSLTSVFQESPKRISESIPRPIEKQASLGELNRLQPIQSDTFYYPRTVAVNRLRVASAPTYSTSTGPIRKSRSGNDIREQDEAQNRCFCGGVSFEFLKGGKIRCVSCKKVQVF